MTSGNMLGKRGGYFWFRFVWNSGMGTYLNA